ncbi:2,3-diphosphoglycerate-dependent phosphoglycerate mutase, partial [Pelagibacteraceae bacterium]|nr:2,3-diphosphoglycerate-dependent phosphoglycerate mutase [Pelagibacteraceae bacterium]
MINLILIRHGQSQWNLENRFTGWYDADLTSKGIEEAKKAGLLIKNTGIQFNYAFTSFQKRAIKTLDNVIETSNLKISKIEKAWQLNERHYGGLQGLNKEETAKKHGEEQVMIWRRSYDTPPPPLDRTHPDHPVNSEIYKSIDPTLIPDTESLKDTYDRTVPYFEKNIEPLIKKGENILISAHGNSLRALCKKIFEISDDMIIKLEIPTGNPIH